MDFLQNTIKLHVYQLLKCICIYSDLEFYNKANYSYMLDYDCAMIFEGLQFPVPRQLFDVLALLFLINLLILASLLISFALAHEYVFYGFTRYFMKAFLQSLNSTKASYFQWFGF